MTVNQLGMALAKLCSSLIPPVDGSICLFSASVLSKSSDFSNMFSTECKTTLKVVLNVFQFLSVQLLLNCMVKNELVELRS